MNQISTSPTGIRVTTPAAPVLIGDRLSLDEAGAIAAGRRPAALSARAAEKVRTGHARLCTAVAERCHIYGITTGFGPLANRLVGPAAIRTLQENLVNHLATGVGPALGWEEARMVVLARLASIARGLSGASPATVDHLLAVLNSDLAPVIPAKGTVGASGDLTPLAHMALALMGRGEFVDPTGTVLSSAMAFSQLGLTPLDLSARDGLALVNGTAAMTGIAALNSLRARRATAWAEALTAPYAELLTGRAEAWHAAFSDARAHPGQAAAAAGLRDRSQGSARLVAEPVAERRLDEGEAGRAEGRALQDAYSIRCAPQVIGAVRDSLGFHDQTVSRELTAATDNPIFPTDGPTALHGGNFMGQHVALASDALHGAVVVLAGLAERQIARLTDEGLNGGLPAFLHRGPPGLNSGLMGAQVTATALLAELRTNAVPAAIQSISTNGANQDVVSMGTIAARKAATALVDTARIQAILAIAVAQGVDIGTDCQPDCAFAPATSALRAWVRRKSAPIVCDRPLSAEIEALAEAIRTEDPPNPTVGSRDGVAMQ